VQFAVVAFAKVAAQMPNVEYQHVGDGALAEAIRARAVELGISDRFKIIEGKTRQENLEMMADSDIFVFPNLHDEPGWVVLEAMTLGLPCVFLLGMPQTPNGHKIGFKATSQKLDEAIDEMADAMTRTYDSRWARSRGQRWIAISASRRPSRSYPNC